MKKQATEDGSVRALKALLRWVTVLENSSSSVVVNLPGFARSRHLDLREVEQGKQALMYIVDSLKARESADKKDD